MGGHRLRLVGPEPLHGLAQEAHQEVVAPLHEAEGELLLDPEVPLGRPAGPAGIAAGLDAQVAPVGEAAEVVARHVGVQREPGRHLGGRDSGRAADVEEDVAPRRIAERGRDGGDRCAEATARGVTTLAVVGGDGGLDRDWSGAHGG